MSREYIDLLKPYGINKKHKCKECKYCYYRLAILGKLAHCDKCGSIDEEDYSCENFFEERNNGV